MARLARLVVPGTPHLVTQHGNRRDTTFFQPGDYDLYLELLADSARRAQTTIWAYCLMPNHVHVILVPTDPDGLRATFAEVHRRYTSYINARSRWTGHLWQGRFQSVAMDDAHVLDALRYVTLNPVRAGLVERPEDWFWSSARAHITGSDDGIVSPGMVLNRTGDFSRWLAGEHDSRRFDALRRAGTTGRPLGSPGWVEALERSTGRTLAPLRRGPKRRLVMSDDVRASAAALG
jgi:putative transposase